jgi:hypothetical protein
MEDPLSAVHDRPHRYLLDSDSEDEEGQGLYSPSASGPSRISKLHISSPPSAQVSISLNGPFEEVILGIGQAGKYLCRKFGADGKVVIKVGDEVVGSGGAVGGRLVLGINDEQVEDSHSLASSLLKVETRSWYVAYGCMVMGTDKQDNRLDVSTFNVYPRPTVLITDRTYTCSVAGEWGEDQSGPEGS